MRNPVQTIVMIIVAAFIIRGLGLPFIIIPIVALYIWMRNKDKEKKDRRGQFNQDRGARSENRRRYDTYRKKDRRDYEQRRDTYQQSSPPRPRTRPNPKPKPRPKPNPYKKSGVDKYKEFEYEAAIEDFKKALEIDNNDIPTHFNIACAYSLTEQKDEAFFHLDRAVAMGFKDFERIRTHDAFAFIRIQDEFEAFEKNKFRLPKKSASADVQPDLSPDLLEQLRKLADLRDRGILTETEFLAQKEKLLR